MTSSDEPPTPEGPGAVRPPPEATPTRSVTSFDAAPTMAFPDDPGAPLTFSRGELVAERYRIVGFLARGGMGEVYEAEDRELGGRVALKTVRLDAAGDPDAIERFKREIQLARQVTHPNVSRIFDLSRHARTGSGGAGGDVLFLTMELLPGQTLADRLHEKGRLSTREALPILEQVVAGLAAAHRVGVVHRDFKSSNVMLVPTATATPPRGVEPGGSAAGSEGSPSRGPSDTAPLAPLRAVVTDFGLARATETSLGEPAAPTTTRVMGTPAYMAPEQVAGDPPTAAVDIYALGVVMYEMVTGQRPFSADTSLALALKRLTEAPTSPRVHVPDLDASWEAAILTCLRVKPAERYLRVEDVARVLRGETVPTRRAAPSRRRRLLRWLVAGSSAVVVLLAAAAVVVERRTSRPALAPGPAAVAPRPSVAVLGLKDLSGNKESAWISAALGEMLLTELAAGEKIRTIPAENVARMKADLSLPETESPGPDALARMGVHLGSEKLVLGSYVVLGKPPSTRLRLDLRIHDAAKGEQVAALSETGTEAELFDLVARAGARLRARLGAGELSESEAEALRAARPSKPGVARLYADGLRKLRDFDALGARGLLEEAVRVDPENPLAHAALADAWSALGYDARARDAAKRAFDLSSHLSREDRLAVEARYRESTKEWTRAAEIHRSLWNFFPDNLEYGLRLAAAEDQAGRAKEALAAIEALGRLPPPAAEDPRIDLAEARVASRVSDFKRQRSAAERAFAKAQRREARQLAAEARLLAGEAAWALGEPERSLALYEEARVVYAASGNRSGLARALTAIATQDYRQGKLEEARRLYDQSLAIHRETGNEFATAWTLHSAANILSDQGDFAGSRKIQEEALAIHRRIGDRNGEAGSLGNIATVLEYQGDLEGARQMHEQALAIFRELGAKGSAAIELTNTAVVLAAQGELDRAKALFEEALAIKRETGNRSSMAFTLFALAEVSIARGELAEARKQHAEALAIRQELRQETRVAESRLALARLALEEGTVTDAESGARSVAELAHAKGIADLEGNALLVLARALLAQGKQAEAGDRVRDAESRLAGTQDPALRLGLRIAAARIRGAEPRGAAAAATSLAALGAEARTTGRVDLMLEAQLALAEVQTRGSRASAAGLARSLEKEARAKGFVLIANRAAALAKGDQPN